MFSFSAIVRALVRLLPRLLLTVTVVSPNLSKTTSLLLFMTLPFILFAAVVADWQDVILEVELVAAVGAVIAFAKTGLEEAAAQGQNS